MPCDKDQVDSPIDTDETFTASKVKKPRQSTTKLFSVKVLPCGSKKNTISIWRAIYYFHTAPVVKYCYHTVSIDFCDITGQPNL